MSQLRYKQQTLVRLSGGEPFVRRDLGEIARLTMELLRPRLLHVTTNGFLTRRVIEFCEQRPRTTPLQILVSLDGTEAKHNEVRGRDTAWSDAFATVRQLAQRRQELDIRLAVNQTIVDQQGAIEHRKLRDLLRPLGVRVNAVIGCDVSATYSLEQEKEAAPAAAGDFSTFGKLDPAAVRELLQEFESGLGEFPLIERLGKRYYFDGIRNRLLHHEGDPNPKCVALNSHMRLFPNGDAPVCQFNSRRVGNLRRESFESLWSGQAIGKEREWVRRCPGCWAECEVLPNAVYSGDILRWAIKGSRRPDEKPSLTPALDPV